MENIALIFFKYLLASYDNFLNDNDLKIDERWNKIKLILESEKVIFADLINYWSLDNEVADIFRITPLLRTIR